MDWCLAVGRLRAATAGVLLVCGSIVVMTGCAEPPPPPPPAPAARAVAPPPRVVAVTIAPEATVLPATSGTLAVQVDRAGEPGEVTFSFGAVPDGVTVSATPIPADARSGEVVIAVAERLGETEIVAPVSVTAAVGSMTGQATVTLRVPKLEPPRFVQDGVAVVQPGGTAAIPLRVEWVDGSRRPVELAGRAAAGTSESIAVTPLRVEPDDAAVTMEVAVSGDVPEGERAVPLVATFMGREASAEVRLNVLRRPFTVGDLRAVWLVPGGARTITLPVSRVAHDGPIEVSADGLPEGVTAATVSLAADASEASLELVAAADAEPAVRSAAVVARAGGVVVTEPLVVRVQSADGEASLPADLFASREAARLVQRGSIGGRLTSESKEALRELYGGTPEATTAVRRGLAWLARTQQPDGSWTLKGASELPVGEPAEEEPQANATAATALGILPFLGEGITHKRAPKEPAEFASYTSVVERGLVFLASKQTRAKGSNDGFFGGSMYAHCLATIAFCEAYGLSRDERVKINAKQGIKYLLAAQDPDGGGWRYGPRQRGDLSVTGWVVIALRSAQLANLSVPMKQLRKAERYVESVVGGPDDAPASRYRYEAGKPETVTMTAAGLLSRLYLGWSREEPDLNAGRDYLMEHMPPAYGETLGPLYYYYYATQVLHHLEGEEFDLWNHRMREHLLRLQRTSGDLEGSWNPRGSDRGKEGGRMYSTALSLLTLQVYYRHLPMYRDVGKPASSSAADDESGEMEPTGEPTETP